jgi:hypothetical protein
MLRFRSIDFERDLDLNGDLDFPFFFLALKVGDLDLERTIVPWLSLTGDLTLLPGEKSW